MTAMKPAQVRRVPLSFEQMVLRRRNFQWLAAHSSDDRAKLWKQAEDMALFGRDATTPMG
jgi:hypothetical protein